MGFSLAASNSGPEPAVAVRAVAERAFSVFSVQIVSELQMKARRSRKRSATSRRAIQSSLNDFVVEVGADA